MTNQNENQALSTTSSSPAERVANPRRGQPRHDDAVAFVEAYPIGSKLTVDEFDAWAGSRGLFVVPSDVPKSSDQWMAHLQRRHQLRYSINVSGAHPRMIERGHPPFVVETASLGKLVVRSPEEAIRRNRVAQAVDALISTKKRQLRYLMESADWAALPQVERNIAEEIYDDIDGFREEIEVKTRRLNAKFMRLETTLRRGIESGAVQPRNGGIRALIDGSEEEE